MGRAEVALLRGRYSKMDCSSGKTLGTKLSARKVGCSLALKVHEQSADACLAGVPRRGVPAKCAVAVFALITFLTLPSLSSVFLSINKSALLKTVPLF